MTEKLRKSYLNSQRTGVSTFASRTSPGTGQSLQKSFHLFDPRKIELKKFSSPSENKKYATAQTNTTKTVKLNIDNGLQRWTDRRPTGNMGLASCGVKCLNSSSVFQINFSAGLTVLCPEIPHERQAQKRYRLQKSGGKGFKTG
jgi:hypothetical protein